MEGRFSAYSSIRLAHSSTVVSHASFRIARVGVPIQFPGIDSLRYANQPCSRREKQ